MYRDIMISFNTAKLDKVIVSHIESQVDKTRLMEK